MTENRSKTVVIIALCLTLIFMGVGFAALSQNLNITANGTIDAKWDIAIHDFTATPSGTATVSPESYDAKGTSFTANFTLGKPGDSVTFTGTIKNLGTIDATLESVTSSWDENATGNTYTPEGEDASETTVPYVTKTITTMPTLNSDLPNTDGTAQISITYTFNPDATQVPTGELKVTDTITFVYNQK